LGVRQKVKSRKNFKANKNVNEMFVSLLPWKMMKETLPEKLDFKIIINQINQK
jgi:hypothetical protein